MNWATTANADGSIYTGPITLDLQNQRSNASCALNISPCLLDGTVITTVDVVKDMTFTAQSFNTFYQGYVGCPPTNLVRLWCKKTRQYPPETCSCPQPLMRHTAD